MKIRAASSSSLAKKRNILGNFKEPKSLKKNFLKKKYKNRIENMYNEGTKYHPF